MPLINNVKSLYNNKNIKTIMLYYFCNNSIILTIVKTEIQRKTERLFVLFIPWWNKKD